MNGRFVSGVSQVGTDRIIELRFNDGQLRLYLEFFSAGNVVLTDANSKVLALQRTVAAFRSASLDVTLSVGSPYAIGARKNVAEVPELKADRLREVLQKAIAADAPKTAAAADGGAAPVAAPPAKKKKKTKGLSRILALSFTDLSQVLIDHNLLLSGFDTTTAAQPEDILADEARLQALLKVLQDVRTETEGLTKAGANCRGYIIATKKEVPESAEEEQAVAAPESTTEDTAAPAAAPSKRTDLDYVDFHPFSPRQFELDPKYVVLPFDTFNQAADEFYSHLQGLKADRQVHQQESAASKKLEATRRDQAQRIESLQETQQLNARKAAAIQANQDWVQLAIDAVNEQLQLGMDWGDLEVMIENSASSNPVAALIKLPMKLAEGTITLCLDEEPEEGWEEEYEDGAYDQDQDRDREGEGDEDQDGEYEGRKMVDVDVKLALSAWSNAREYYDQKRVAAIKEQKTKEVTSMALRNAEKKVAEELKRVQKTGKPAPQLIRRQLWFEKFLWFISSDGHLILAARESQQCEMLYRQHLRRGDVYVHADTKGSPGMIIIKNRPDTDVDAPIPPATLAQAGTLAVCASEAWDTKAGMGAYWVHSNQVFKSTANGDILPPGSFDVRGEKNHMPPPQRVLGFGLYFKISDASRVNHGKHQVVVPQANDNRPVEHDEDEDEEEEEEEEEVAEEKPETEEEAQETAEKAEEEPTPEPVEPAEETVEESKDAEEDDEDEAEKEDEEKKESEENTESVAPAAGWLAKNKSHLRASSPTPSRGSSVATSSAGGSSKRGQKGKAKKLAKYKDQDDEDRARAEKLIGIAAGREKQEAKLRAKAQREAEIAAYEERRRFQKEKQMQKMRDYEAVRQAKLQSGAEGAGDDLITEGDDIDAGNLDLLNSLVARPAPGDEILEVVPVCGPWMALSKLKYKVKLQPGPTKKGRAMRDVLERWKRAGEAGKTNMNIIDEESRDPERMWPREVELISGIKMEEASNSVPVGKLTLMQGGGFGGSGGGGGKGGKGGAKGGSGKNKGVGKSGAGGGKGGKGGGGKR